MLHRFSCFCDELQLPIGIDLRMGTKRSTGSDFFKNIREDVIAARLAVRRGEPREQAMKNYLDV